MQPYSHAIISNTLNELWFKTKKSEGVKYRDHFNPIPLSLIAIILTAVCAFSLIQFLLTFSTKVESSLSQYKTGLFKSSNFTAEVHACRWDYHMDGLKQLKDKSFNWTCKLQKNLYERGM